MTALCEGAAAGKGCGVVAGAEVGDYYALGGFVMRAVEKVAGCCRKHVKMGPLTRRRAHIPQRSRVGVLARRDFSPWSNKWIWGCGRQRNEAADSGDELHLGNAFQTRRVIGDDGN